MCRLGKIYFRYVVMAYEFFKFGCMSILGLVLKSRRKFLAFFRFLRWLPKHHLSPPSRRSLELWRLVIDNLAIDDVKSFFLLFKSLALVYDSVSSFSKFLCDFLDEIKSLGWT